MKKRAILVAAMSASLSACSSGPQVYGDVRVPEAKDFRPIMPAVDYGPRKTSPQAVFVSANGEACVRKDKAATVCETEQETIEIRDVLSGTI